MSRTRIKICGITSPELATIACAAGADAIGLMFFDPSSRHLEIEQARAIRACVTPYVTSVAVMVNPDIDYVRAIINQVGVGQLQFHGEEDNAFCESFGLPYVKALRVAEDTDLKAAERKYPGCSGILLDTHLPGLYGGSGKTFDWNKARFGAEKPLILAGGLVAKNVAEAISTTRPYGVDVSSGVETNGIKDPAKIRQFCANARNSI